MQRSTLHTTFLLCLFTATALAVTQSCAKTESEKPKAAQSPQQANKPTATPTAPAKTTPAAPKDARNALTTKALEGATAVLTAANLFYKNKRTYPAGLSALRKEALISPRGELDPWNQRYRIVPANTGGAQTGMSVCSNGPDKVADTADDICAKKP